MTQWFQHEIQLPSFPRGLHPITHIVLDAVPEIAQLRVGLLHVFLKHTSASLSINENADPSVRRDILMVLDNLVPGTLPFTHGEGNGDAHAKAALVGSSVTIPVQYGRLLLGTWQGVYFAEFDGPRRRNLMVQLLPAAGS